MEHRFCWRIPWHIPRAWPTKWHESCYLKSWNMENSACQRQISFWKWFEKKQRAAIDKCLLKRMTNKWTQGYLLWHVPWTEVTAYIKICIFLALWINIKQECNCLYGERVYDDRSGSYKTLKSIVVTNFSKCSVVTNQYWDTEPTLSLTLRWWEAFLGPEILARFY